MLMAEALAYAYNDKRTRVGDPAFVDVPVNDLLDKSYAQTLAARILNGDKAVLNRLPHFKESNETSHIVVFDKDGNAFSMTHTLGAPSGVIPPGSGFILNGCMGIFDPRPGLFLIHFCDGLRPISFLYPCVPCHVQKSVDLTERRCTT